MKRTRPQPNPRMASSQITTLQYPRTEAFLFPDDELRTQRGTAILKLGFGWSLDEGTMITGLVDNFTAWKRNTDHQPTPVTAQHHLGHSTQPAERSPIARLVLEIPPSDLRFHRVSEIPFSEFNAGACLRRYETYFDSFHVALIRLVNLLKHNGRISTDLHHSLHVRAARVPSCSC